MACKSRAEISEKVREEVGFRVVRTADRSGRAEFGQFLGDAAGFGELLGGKLLGGRLGASFGISAGGAAVRHGTLLLGFCWLSLGNGSLVSMSSKLTAAGSASAADGSGPRAPKRWPRGFECRVALIAS